MYKGILIRWKKCDEFDLFAWKNVSNHTNDIRLGIKRKVFDEAVYTCFIRPWCIWIHLKKARNSFCPFDNQSGFGRFCFCLYMSSYKHCPTRKLLLLFRKTLVRYCDWTLQYTFKTLPEIAQHKKICQLVEDYVSSRLPKHFVDCRAYRINTLTIRPWQGKSQ